MNTETTTRDHQYANMWWHAARPKTLLASIAPVLVGLACTHAQGIPLVWSIAVNTLLCAVLLQVLANFANDYFDGVEGIDIKRRFGPMRLTQSGKVPPEMMRKVLMIMTVGIFLLALPLIWRGGLTILTLGLLALASTFLYTTTPLSFSRHALGELSAGIFFGPVAVWGTAFLQGDLPRSSNVLLVSLAPGLLAASIMAINNLRDIESDRAANKQTLAVLLGMPYARLIPAVASVMAFVVCLVYAVAWSPLFFLPYLTLPLAQSIWMKCLEGPVDAQLNVALAHAGKLTFLFSLLLSLALVFYGA